MPTVRTGTIALRLDYGDLQTGFAKSANISQQFIDKEIGLAQKLAAEQKKADEAFKRYRGALSHNNYGDQDKYMGQYTRAKENVAKIEARQAELLSQKKQALAERDAEVTRQLSDAYYAATHTHEEVALRDLRRRRAEMSAMYANNPAMLQQIDQTYAAQAAALSGGGAGAGGRGGSGGGYHARRLMREEMKYAGSMALGMGGGEIGMAASGLLYAGSTAAAVVAPLIAIGMGYKSAHEGAIALADAQDRHAKAARESAHWLKEIAAPQTTGSGEQFRSRAHELREQAADMVTEGKRQARTMGLGDALGLGLDALWHGGLENTSFAKGVREDVAEHNRKVKEAQWLDVAAKQEERAAEYNRKYESEASVTGARIEAMPEGPERRKADFENRQKNAQEKFDEEWREKLANATRAVDHTTPGNKDHWDAQVRLDQLGKEHEAAKENFQNEQGWQKIGFDRQQDYHRQDMAFKTDEMKATSGKLGYARQVAAFEARYDKEIALAKRAGEGEWALYAQKDYERKDMAAQRDEALRTEEVAKKIQLAETTRDYAEATRLARAEEQHRLELAGATGQKLQELMALWDKNRQAAADAPLLREIRDTNRELEVMKGRLSKEDAERERLREQNPQASQQYIDEAASKKREVQLREQFKNPLQEYRKFRDEVAEAEQKGIITHEQAQIELRNRMHGILGPSGEGHLSDAASKWGDIQQALNSDDVPKMTYDQIVGLRDEMVALRREGIRLRG